MSAQVDAESESWGNWFQRWGRYAETGIAKQFFLFSTSWILIMVLPAVWAIFTFAVEQLIFAMVPPSAVIPVGDATQPPIQILETLNSAAIAWRLLYALVIYLAMVNPLATLIETKWIPALMDVTDPRKSIVRQLRIRAVGLKLTGWVVLFLILGLMIVGLLIFVSADRLATPADAATKGASEASIIVSTLTTRIGAVLILIWLVKILVNLYRYCAKLSAFNNSRADALTLMMCEELCSPSPANLKKLVWIFGADRVAFDESKSPVEDVIAGLSPAFKGIKEQVERLGKPTSGPV